MRRCANHQVTGKAVLAGLCLAAWLTACGGEQGAERFRLAQVEGKWSGGRIDVRIEQSLRLSAEARDALVHGVPLVVEVDLRLNAAKGGRKIAGTTSRYELRYLPLSERYQLTPAGNGVPSSYPRLRHALAALGRLDIPLETGVLPAGQYELQVRTRLDRHELPPPMRLPSLLSAAWAHDSDWTSWSLDTSNGV